MSLRNTLAVVALSLGAIALATAVALVAITTRMKQESVHLSEASGSIRASEEMETNLLISGRERFLFELTGDRAHEAAWRSARAELAQWLASARQFVDSDEEAALLDAIAPILKDERPGASGAGLSPIDAYHARIKAENAAYELMERLVELNVAQIQNRRVSIDHWNTVADVLGTSLAVLLVLIVGASLFVLSSRFYRPFRLLRAAIFQLKIHNLEARVPEEGPAEFRDVAMEINAMAHALARQKENQLGFIAAIAHDLRNPLTALKTATGLLERAAELPSETQRHAAAVVMRQIRRLEQMIGDLLDVSLIESGRMELRRERCDLRDVARATHELFQSVSTQHTLRLELPDRPVTALCDAARIEQVMNNLVSNAIKYSPAGGTVEILVDRQPGQAVLRVRDPGIGISKPDQEKLFEPFRRVGLQKHTIPGIGLGLSAARRIVEAHGGGIGVSSTVGAGTEFRVTLPSTEEAEGLDRAPAVVGVAQQE